MLKQTGRELFYAYWRHQYARQQLPYRRLREYLSKILHPAGQCGTCDVKELLQLFNRVAPNSVLPQRNDNMKNHSKINSTS